MVPLTGSRTRGGAFGGENLRDYGLAACAGEGIRGNGGRRRWGGEGSPSGQILVITSSIHKSFGIRRSSSA